MRTKRNRGTAAPGRLAASRLAPLRAPTHRRRQRPRAAPEPGSWSRRAALLGHRFSALGPAPPRPKADPRPSDAGLPREREDAEARPLVVSQLGIEKAPAPLGAAVQLARSWLDQSIAHVDKLGAAASEYFNPSDLDYLKGDFGQIRQQLDRMLGAGEPHDEEGAGPLQIADVRGFRFVGLDMGNVLADCRGPGWQDGSLITFYPRSLRQSLPGLAHTVIHELSHASALATDDVAYGHQSAFASLPEVPGIARKNADSYSYLAAYIGTHASELRGAADREPGAVDEKLSALSDEEESHADRLFERAERLGHDALESLDAVAGEMEAALAAGEWTAGAAGYRRLAEEFPRAFKPPGAGLSARRVTAGLELLESVRTFLEERLLEGVAGRETLEKDPLGDYVVHPKTGKVGTAFFLEAEPDRWMEEMAAGLPGSAEEHRTWVEVARFLAEEVKEKGSAEAAGAGRAGDASDPAGGSTRETPGRPEPPARSGSPASTPRQGSPRAQRAVSAIPPAKPLIQCALSVIDRGFPGSDWSAIRSKIVAWNRGPQGLLLDLKALADIDAAARTWQEGKKEQNAQIKTLLEEIPKELQKIPDTSPLLSQKAESLDSAEHLLGAAERAQISGLESLVGDASFVVESRTALTPAREIYAIKALAAGRSPKEVGKFLDKLGTQSDEEVVSKLSLTRVGQKGARQQYADFCASATVQIFEARFDPIVALELVESNKDVTERMDEGVGGLHDPEWLEEALEKEESAEGNNVHMLKKQYAIAKTYSTDKSGRLGLNPEDRTRALNDLAKKTGLRYKKITTAGMRILRVYKKPVKEKPSKEEVSKEESPPKRELSREVSTAQFPTEERMKSASVLIRTALQHGAPVGVGVGGHAELFVDYQDPHFILFEPSFGTVKKVKASDVKAGSVGTDPIANLILPETIGNEDYANTLKVLEELGEAEDTVLEIEEE